VTTPLCCGQLQAQKQKKQQLLFVVHGSYTPQTAAQGALEEQGQSEDVFPTEVLLSLGNTCQSLPEHALQQSKP